MSTSVRDIENAIQSLKQKVAEEQRLVQLEHENLKRKKRELQKLQEEVNGIEAKLRTDEETMKRNISELDKLSKELVESARRVKANN